MAAYNKQALLGQFGINTEDDPTKQIPGLVPPIGGAEATQGLAVEPTKVTVPDAGAPAVAAPAAPNYRDGSTVNLPGWDSSRTDNTGKMEFGRFAQSKGGHITGDDVRAFVAANPSEWEIDPHSSQDDPHIRQKQAWLNDPANGDGKTGATSIYQDVIRDAGPGGANAAAFGNVEGDPSLGYAAPTGGPAPTGGNAGLSMAQSNLDPLMRSDFFTNIQQALAGVQRPNLDALLAQLGAR